jgi:hypothetical protein
MTFEIIRLMLAMIVSVASKSAPENIRDVAFVPALDHFKRGLAIEVAGLRDQLARDRASFESEKAEHTAAFEKHIVSITADLEPLGRALNGVEPRHCRRLKCTLV